MGIETHPGDSFVARRDYTDYFFRTLLDGTRVFNPAGIIGRRGYIVEAHEDEQAIRAALVWYRRVGALIAVPLGACIGFLLIQNLLRAYPSLSPSSVLTVVVLVIALTAAVVVIDLIARAKYFRRFTARMQPIVTPNDSSKHLRELYQSTYEDISAYKKYIVILFGVLFAIIIVSLLLLMAIPASATELGPAL